MRKPRPLALVGAGALNTFHIARLPGVAEQIGPVKAASFRLASRISNALRCGFPVRTYQELKESRMVLICLPDESAESIIQELADADFLWRGKCAVLGSETLDSSVLRPLAIRGACVASLWTADLPEGERIMGEGDKFCIREVRRLMLFARSHLLELKSGTKPLYLAATTFATSLLTPLIDASVGCFEQAGLKGGHAVPLTERMVQNTLRGYVKAGRKSWNGPLARGGAEGLVPQIEAVARFDPELAFWLEEAGRWVVDRFGAKGGEPALPAVVED